MSLPGTFDDHHIVVSVELLKLLHWLIEHDQESLKRLMKRALEQQATIDSLGSVVTSEDMKEEVSHIFMLLETLLHEVITEQTQTKQFQRALLPALDHIDMTQCDEETINKSVAKATAAAELDHQVNPKEILYRELLRQWHPDTQLNN